MQRIIHNHLNKQNDLTKRGRTSEPYEMAQTVMYLCEVSIVLIQATGKDGDESDHHPLLKLNAKVSGDAALSIFQSDLPASGRHHRQSGSVYQPELLNLHFHQLLL